MKQRSLLVLLLFLFTPLLSPGDVTLPVCSAAIHDSYKANGPDGLGYPTWHPQVDTKAGCHFDHEHGSNPAAFGVPVGKTAPMYPLFGYTAKTMPEGHAGFKVYVFEVAGKRWQILHHFGTANAMNAACNQHHTLDMRALDLNMNQLIVDIHVMGDFGRSVDQSTPAVPLTPVACPNQAAGWNASVNGQRVIPVGPNAAGYEPWRANLPYNILGFTGYSFTINTPDAQTKCNYITCTANLPHAGVGAFRFITWGNLGFSSGAGFDGCTNMHGTAVMGCGEVGAIRQYVAPSLLFNIPNPTPGCRPWGRLEYDYLCGINGDSEVHYKLNPFVTGAN